MKKLFFFAIFSLNVFAEPCNVEFYSKIYKNDSTSLLSTKDIIKSSSCAEDINRSIIQSLLKKEGDFYVGSLEKELNNQNIHITPRKIFLGNLQNIFRDHLTTGSNLYFFDVKSISNVKTLALNEDESINVNCDSCNSFGEKNIKVEISSAANNSARVIWYTSKIFAKVKVIKSKNALSFQQKNLSKDDFYIDETYTMNPDNLLGSLENIQFYKPNRTILQGTIITNLDISPVNLVNYGVPTKIILKNQSLSLTKMATPVRSAQFGEVVELRLSNNKSISGKVVDYNQVVIEI